MPTRFFVRPDQIKDGLAVLDADDAHHLRVVLKAAPGERLSILDGIGNEYPATLETLGKTSATARLGPAVTLDTEPQTRITVAQALPKMAEKAEQVLQRGTEIGVSAFHFFQSAKSLPHLAGERHEKRLARSRAIVKTAAEQAHRALLPTLRIEGGLTETLRQVSEHDLALIAHPDGNPSGLKSLLAPSITSILILIGPESGFTDEEIRTALRHGVQPVSLGPRILRTETAAMVMAAQILFALE